jgi:hypothetical protein
MLLYSYYSLCFWYLIISGKMILSKKHLSLQGGDHPSEMDPPEEAHVSVIAVVILNLCPHVVT